MRIADLIKRPPITVTPSTTIKQAAEVMSRERIGFLVVVEPPNVRTPVGVVSERDILTAIARGLSYDVEISKIMNKPITIRSDAPIVEAARKMREHGIRHLVVVDERGELVGVISVRDLVYERGALEALAEEFRREVPTTP